MRFDQNGAFYGLRIKTVHPDGFALDLSSSLPRTLSLPRSISLPPHLQRPGAVLVPQNKSLIIFLRTHVSSSLDLLPSVLLCSVQ